MLIKLFFSTLDLYEFWPHKFISSVISQRVNIWYSREQQAFMQACCHFLLTSASGPFQSEQMFILANSLDCRTNSHISASMVYWLVACQDAVVTAVLREFPE